MKKHLANLLTGLRILCGIWLLAVPVFSPVFYTAYLLGGFTDMTDGTVARKTKSVTAFGEKLDSLADTVFLAAALGKLLPVLALPVWLWVWMLLILLLRTGQLITKKCFVLPHTAMNRLTGLLLFLLPLTLPVLELKYSGSLVCTVATAAALREGFCGKMKDRGI